MSGDGPWFDEATHSEVSLLLKPGQKIDVYTRIVLAADVSLPKLIVDDANNKVWRYDLKGQVTPLAAPFADPAVKDGSAALDEVPGKAGVFYPAVLDLRVDRVDVPATVPEGMDVGSDQRVVVVYLTFHNANLVPQSMVSGAAYSFAASLLDQDGIGADYQHLYLGTRELWVGLDSALEMPLFRRSLEGRPHVLIGALGTTRWYVDSQGAMLEVADDGLITGRCGSVREALERLARGD